MWCRWKWPEIIHGGMKRLSAFVILLMMILVTAAVMPASAVVVGEVEIRGPVVSVSGTSDNTMHQWGPLEWGAFWYNIKDNMGTETLTCISVFLVTMCVVDSV